MNNTNEPSPGHPDAGAGNLELGESLKPSDYLRMIGERWLLGIVLALLVTVPFMYFSLKQKPVYQAASTLIFDPTGLDLPTPVTGDANLKGRIDDIMQKQFLQINSLTMLSRVIDALTPEEKAAVIKPYKTKDNPNPSIASIIQNANHIKASGGETIYLIFDHRDPEMAALLANVYADQYLSYLRDKAGQNSESGIKFLQGQVEDLRQRVKQGEMDLQNYREKHHLQSLDGAQNVIAQRVSSVNQSLEQAKIDLLKASTQYQQVQNAIKSGESLMDVPVIANFGNVQQLYSNLKDLRAQRQTLAVKYLEKHPLMIQNAAQIKEAQKQLQEAYDQAVAYVKNTRDQAQSTVNDLKAELAKAQQDSMNLDKQSVDYNVLQRKLENDKQTLSQLQTRLNDANVASQLTNTSMRILDRAFAPGGPISPNRKKIMMVSVGLFGFIFLGVPIGLGMVNNKLKSKWDVENFLGTEFIGEIPRITTIEKERLPLLVQEDQEDLEVEYFTILFSQLQLISQEELPKVMLITSSRPEEGKSFVASNLACAFGKHGLRTVLVDCDFRRPSHHRYHNLPNNAGVLRWYESKKELEPGVRLSDVPELEILKLSGNFHLLRSGGSSKRPTAIIRSEPFAKLMEALKSQYDLVIIDSPPGLVFPDPLLLADYADEIVYICRHNTVNRFKAKQLVDRLRATHARMLGVIFNAASSSRSSSQYDYYDYKAYKEYQSS